MDKYLSYAKAMVERGGPRPHEYLEIDAWILQVYSSLDSGDLPKDFIAELRQTLAPVLSPVTMFGLAWRKLHGYAGDFEIIDRHYLTYVAPDPQLSNWDYYWHANPAAGAVRNRKRYFHQLLTCHGAAKLDSELAVLNIASGPARDVLEYVRFTTQPVHFDCIDNDPEAIAHASSLCAGFHNVVFRHGNALRLRPKQQYDLVWSAGLFDYFSDRTFVFMLRRLLRCVSPGGELVIGNYAMTDPHPNLCWLRFVDWQLHHRSRERLIDLALRSGISADRIRIGSESENVTLFLHIKQNDSDQT
jgi:hypothetical protein